MRKDFLFGVSTSAFQIEGDDGTQGRGKSVWDVFCEKKGTIYMGQNAKVAADHYNRYVEDIQLMKELGINSYRFSTSWSRILPEGTGKINQKGIDFYARLLDEMIEAGIQPFWTMYHWDLPQILSEKGGLQNEDFPEWFAEYAQILVKYYGEHIRHCITFNEPINVVHSGYHAGVFAPAHKLSQADTLKCLHNMLLAHGKASDLFHSYNPNIVTGVAMSTFEEYPADGTPQSLEQARKAFFEKELPSESVDVYLDPIYLGEYPQRLLEKFPFLNEKKYVDGVRALKGKTGMLCYNNYSGRAIDGYGNVVERKNLRLNDMGTPIDANGLYWGCKFLAERYQLPVYITENGCASKDFVNDFGVVEDSIRIHCLKENLEMVKKLIREGEDIRGYFVWSFLDNFEWLFGYSKRFGLVYIDYDTLKRIPKQSYYWFQNYLHENK